MRSGAVLISIVAAGWLIAEDGVSAAKQKVQITKTERVAFPAAGVIRFKNSIGDLTIEAWDQSDMEITTTKSTKREYSAQERAQGSSQLDKVVVAIERHGDEILVDTEFPRHRAFPPAVPWSASTNFDLEYHVNVPRNARVSIGHDVGEVHVDGVTGDIEARLLQGEILLHLPEDEQYAIDAKCDVGSVNSDFPGVEKRRPWLIGHRVAYQSPSAKHRLNLRVGAGDIMILRTRIPKSPAVSAQASGGQ